MHVCICALVRVRACVRACKRCRCVCVQLRASAGMSVHLCLLVLMMSGSWYVVLLLSWLIVCAPHSTPRLHKGTCMYFVDILNGEFELNSSVGMNEMEAN